MYSAGGTMVAWPAHLHVIADSFTRVLSTSSSRNAFACSSMLLSNLLLILCMLHSEIQIRRNFHAGNENIPGYNMHAQKHILLHTHTHCHVP